MSESISSQIQNTPPIYTNLRTETYQNEDEFVNGCFDSFRNLFSNIIELTRKEISLKSADTKSKKLYDEISNIGKNLEQIIDILSNNGPLIKNIDKLLNNKNDNANKGCSNSDSVISE
jgi:hypothetical protein